MSGTRVSPHELLEAVGVNGGYATGVSVRKPHGSVNDDCNENAFLGQEGACEGGGDGAGADTFGAAAGDAHPRSHKHGVDAVLAAG